LQSRFRAAIDYAMYPPVPDANPIAGNPMKERRLKANGLVANCPDYGGAGNPPMRFL